MHGDFNTTMNQVNYIINNNMFSKIMLLWIYKKTKTSINF